MFTLNVTISFSDEVFLNNALRKNIQKDLKNNNEIEVDTLNSEEEIIRIAFQTCFIKLKTLPFYEDVLQCQLYEILSNSDQYAYCIQFKFNTLAHSTSFLKLNNETLKLIFKKQFGSDAVYFSTILQEIPVTTN